MNQPTISILLPVRNEEKFIGSCLEHIFRQTGLSDNVEVIVSDGMSTDGTREIIRENQVNHPNLSLINNPAKIVPVGLNLAIQRSLGEIILRVDGHCLIAPDYVHKCVEHIQREGVDGVGGPMESIGESQMAKAIAIGMSSPFGVGNSAFRTLSSKTMLVDTVPFPAYTRQIIERAGLYDEELIRNQDDEYNYRIRELGGKILLADDVRSTYFSRTSLKGLWRQYYQYGFWKVRVLQKHPRQMSLRQFVPPVFVLALLLAIIVALSSGCQPLFFAVPLLYLFANLLASFLTASKRGWASFSLLPLIFAILHLSYGFGFLVGLLKFSRRWGDKRGKTPVFMRQDA